jgi:hypothetical protein
MWISERNHLGVIGLVANQQGNAGLRPRMRRQQSNQQNNDRGPQHEERPRNPGRV